MNISDFVFIDSAEYDEFFELMTVQVSAGQQKTVPHSKGEFIPVVLVSVDGKNWYQSGKVNPPGFYPTVSIQTNSVWISAPSAGYVKIIGMEI